MDGEGVFYDFINDFKKNICLEFNEIPYLKTSDTTTDGLRFRILDGDSKLSDNDLFLFEDYYVAVGKEYRRINHIKDMKDITFGVFEDDADTVSYYLKSGTNISYKKYKSIDELYKALDNNDVNMIIVPNMMYLDKIIDNSSYSINYYFTEMTDKIVLTLGNDKELNNIVKKYFNKWKETKFVDEYDKDYFNYY